ncbi:beta-1,3-galactosyltransferase 1-like [Babylonia areolata]|uniref:beta-1,3-galactosyltransferase 1-like n=1 Tax=Babylonia areolata TaxID=304850 RepID=UPI003FD25CA9
MKRLVVVVVGLATAGILLQVGLMVRDTPAPTFLRPPAPYAIRPTAPHVTTTHPPVTSALTRSGGVGEGGGVREGNETRTFHHPHHDFPFLLNEPGTCRAETELVVVVVTAPNNTEDRQVVRETWGSLRDHPQHQVALVFLLGSVRDPGLQARLVAESRQHGDLVQEDFVDSYRNLSLKSVAMLRWVSTFCNSSRYVLKADDDMYVNLTNLLTALRHESLSHDSFVLGNVFTGARPVQDRKSKWYTPLEAFSEAVYPRYTSGTAYAMTTSAAQKLFTASAEVPLFWLEDIYITGLCSRHAGVPVLNHGGFSYVKHPVDGCHFRKVISAHRYSAQEKRDIFRQVKDGNLQCR